jgi:hypothetical protein
VCVGRGWGGGDEGNDGHGQLIVALIPKIVGSLSAEGGGNYIWNHDCLLNLLPI